MGTRLLICRWQRKVLTKYNVSVTCLSKHPSSFCLGKVWQVITFAPVVSVLS